MHWFKNLQIMKKLLSGFGLIAMLIGVIGYMGVQGMGAMTIVVVSVATILLVLGLGYSMAQMIAGSLGATVTVLQAVASGDFTQQLDIQTRDEVGQMAVALNQAVDSMRATMAAIGQNAQTLARASEELTSVSQQMSANAEETSAQAGVVSAAGEQVSNNVQLDPKNFEVR